MHHTEIKTDHVGHARVSTEDQRLDLQLNALRKYGVPDSQLFCEHFTGKTLKRPQFQIALQHLRPGDTLVVWKLDRLGRNTAEVSKFAIDLEKKGVKLKSLTEGIETDSAMGRFMFHNMAAIAQLERDMISVRTKAGLEAAKLRGTWKPRNATISKEQWAFMQAAVAQEPLLSAGALCRLADMPRRKKKPFTPKRTTLNNYMDLLRNGKPYPFEEG